MMDKPAQPPHGRKLGLIGTALTKARNPKGDVQALSAVRDELEIVLIESNFCEDTPFSWITVSVRFGLKDEDEPHYKAINKKYGDLPLSIEVSTEKLQGVGLSELKSLFKDAVLKALIHAGKKYGRPIERLEAIAT